jgi:nitrate reductase gamma subunit
VLPPLTFVIFLAAVLSRLWAWKKLPQPGMTVFPAAKGSTGSAVIKETLLFPSLFRGNKPLWVISWLFHALLVLICIGHIRVVADFPALWAALKINPDTMSVVVGGAAGVMIMLMVVLLIGRRFTLSRVREISGVGDHFALFLILAIVLTGNVMRFFSHFELAQTREYFAALVTLSSPVVPQNGWFLLHFLLGQILFLYIPFSKIMHFGGIFFTQAAVKRS